MVPVSAEILDLAVVAGSAGSRRAKGFHVPVSDERLFDFFPRGKGFRDAVRSDERLVRSSEGDEACGGGEGVAVRNGSRNGDERRQGGIRKVIPLNHGVPERSGISVRDHGRNGYRVFHSRGELICRTVGKDGIRIFGSRRVDNVRRHVRKSRRGRALLEYRPSGYASGVGNRRIRNWIPASSDGGKLYGFREIVQLGNSGRIARNGQMLLEGQESHG